MKATEVFELMDTCTTTSEHLKSLLNSIQHSHSKLLGSSMESCIALSTYLEDKQSNLQIKLFDRIRRLNIVRRTVNGDGA